MNSTAGPRAKIKPTAIEKLYLPPARSVRITRRLLLPIVLVVAWWQVTAHHIVGPLFVPSPHDLWNSVNGMRGVLPSAIVSTVTQTITGFALGAGIGLALGLLLAYSRAARDILGLGFDAIRPVPVFALIPLFTLWFGIGRAPQIALIAVGTFVILGVATVEAIRNVPAIYVRASLTLGASRRDVYRTVVLPSIAPHLLGAIRVAAAASWGLDVAAEFIGSQNGLGYLMIQRESYLDTSGIVLIVLIYCACALILDRVIKVAEQKLLPWAESHATGGAAGAVLGLEL